MPDTTASNPQLRPLSRLREGECGWFHAASLQCAECELLQAMGLTDQCPIRVCQSGEPCIVQVNSTRLAIAASVARTIMISAAAPAS